jgi:predicted metal-dependent HD superfamily phosphohydrolase
MASHVNQLREWQAEPVSDTYPLPLDDAALSATWHAAWSSLGRPAASAAPSAAPSGLRDELLAAWSEPHRHYHDQRHLRECLALWTRWRHLCQRPGEVAIALWFHDAIYDPQSQHNELNSAAWATRCLMRAGVDTDTAQRVHDLVMATQHGFTQDTEPAALRSNLDAQLLIDIDLSILGSPPERFERYDRDVRKEYAWVPGLRYQQARAQVLQSFLDRPRIFHAEPAVALLEAQARINLTAALSRLAQ